jgi:hypothetical protein
MTARIRAAWLALPPWARSFAIDVAEGAGAAVLALNLVVPHTLVDVQAQAVVIGTACAAPAIAAFRRHVLPAIVAWFASTFARPEGEA